MKYNDNNVNYEVETMINSAVKKLTPDLTSAIAESIREKRVNGTAEFYKAKTNSRSLALRFAAVAAAFFLVFSTMWGIAAFRGGNSVAAVIDIDVNPSIEISVNDNEKVISVTASNADGEIILDGMDLKGSQLKVALNAIIGSMLKNHYIDELANSVLISVESDDTVLGNNIKDKVAKEVDEYLKSCSINAAVLSQLVNKDEAAAKLAESYNISAGKASYILDLAHNANLTTDEQIGQLTGLSINDLNLIATSKDIKLSSVSTSGKATDSKYIGNDAARDIAVKAAGANLEELFGLEVEMDVERGVMIYEIEFYWNHSEYEYDINAETGEIVWSEIEPKTASANKANVNTADPAADFITKEEASAAAYKHAGVNEADSTPLENKFDLDDGVAHYDVRFFAGGIKYDYDIDAVSGEVIKYETKGNAANAGKDMVGEDAAKAAALTHAGVKEADIYGFNCHLDYDDGKVEYGIEFYTETTEYEYDVDAYTGNVVKYETEMNEAALEMALAQNNAAADSVSAEAAADGIITADEAKAIAFKHAGVSEAEATRVECELDRDDGVQVYEIEFNHDYKEYSYEINAATGKIVDYEIDAD